MISIVIPFRNRSLERLGQVIGSFRKHTKVPLEIVLSDFGSESPSHNDIAEFCTNHDIIHVVSCSEGLPWSRAKAINNGVRAARHEWICVVDVDMVLHDPVLDHLMGLATKDTVYFLESIWPQRPRQKWKYGVKNRSFGVFQLVHRSWFDQLQGFNEALEFWGGEDNDWVRRLRMGGAVITWLKAEDFRLVHTWHPWENNPLQRPVSAVWKTLEQELMAMAKGSRIPGWGHAIAPDERPILALGKDSFETIDIAPCGFRDVFSLILTKLHAGVNLELRLGRRRMSRKLERLESLVLLFRPFIQACGLEVRPQVNDNLEAFLLARPVFDSLVADYYLATSLETVRLCARRQGED